MQYLKNLNKSKKWYVHLQGNNMHCDVKQVSTAEPSLGEKVFQSGNPTA